MATAKLAVRPGVNTQATKLAAQNQWNSSNCVRFKDGFIQTLGGCQHLNNTPVVGTARGLHVFQDLSSNDYVAVGTNQRLQLYLSGQISDITPYRRTPSLTNPITTTIGSATATITDAGHGALANDWIYFPVPVTVGGITFTGFYQVVTAATNTYTVLTGTVATSSVTGGGTLTIDYLLASSTEVAAQLYGVGTYGVGIYGVAGKVNLRQWSLDNWGQDLVACPSNGSLYYWASPISAGTPAIKITGTGVPASAAGIFVAMPQRQLVAFGADGGSGQDPLLICWSDVNDFTSWTATATNQAGSFRLSSGAEIVGGIQAQQNGLIWTDIELWSFQYLGYPLVYGFNKVGIGCGLLSMRGVAKVASRVLWISSNGFFAFDGNGVAPLPCSVWDFVFNNIDRTYNDAVFAASNSYFNEVSWYFPTVGSGGQVTSYVKINTVDGSWDYGLLSRTAWTDQSVLGAPIGTDYSGYLQQHETSFNMDGSPIDAWAETGWFDIGDGTFTVFVERLLPDFILSPGATVLLTVKAVDYVGDTPRTYGPFTITSGTQYVVVRARGRFACLRVESKTSNTFWRLGDVLYISSPAGRR